MPKLNRSVSLADLAAAGIQLRPYEAVTIVREVALQVVRGQLAGVPSAHVVRLSMSGNVSIEGPVGAGGRPVVQVAQLLDSLLPENTSAGSQFRVPGGLKLVVARALGTLDLPPFGSLEAFVESLERFSATDPAAAMANLVVSCADAANARPIQPPAEPLPVVAAQVQPFVPVRAGETRPQQPREALTISDIRRARRATGVPLAKVAERSRIPVGLLRQLEWGYFFNWPTGRYGRTQLVRYARAAGLDEELVLSTVAPLIDGAEVVATSPAAAPEPAALTRRPDDLDLRMSPANTVLVPTAATEVHHRRRHRGLVAALATAAAVTMLVPMWWAYPRPPAVPSALPSQAAAGTTGSTSALPSAPVNASEQAREATEEVLPGTAQPTGAAQERAEPALSDSPARNPIVPASAAAGEYQVASDPGAFSPTFASVGTAMFYHADEAKGSALVRADTDGEGAVLRITRIVDDSANNYHVRPSPDGTRIAFDSDRDGERGVYVADGDGQHVRRVSGEGYAAVPSWSPDGRTLAFVRAEPEQPKVWNLWTLKLETGEMRQITKYRVGQPWGGSWFPDGRRIAYSHEDRLIVRDLESGAERVFPSPIKRRQVRTPAVSPDGRRIVFQVRWDGAWLLELPSGAVRKVLEDPTAEEFTWSPDGKRLAYHSRRSGTWTVWVMAPR